MVFNYGYKELKFFIYFVIYLEVLKLKIYNDELLILFISSFAINIKILAYNVILSLLELELESLMIFFFITWFAIVCFLLFFYF